MFTALDAQVASLAHPSTTLVIATAAAITGALGETIRYRRVVHTLCGGVAAAAAVALVAAVVDMMRVVTIASVEPSIDLTPAGVPFAATATVVLACTALRTLLPESPNSPTYTAAGAVAGRGGDSTGAAGGGAGGPRAAGDTGGRA